jgi:uncharacterized membrane protein YozB (DUF420 family)
MIDVHELPALNAALNAVVTVLLVTGYIMIRRGRVRQHQACMLTALGLSAVFLASYVVYHIEVGSIRFTTGGWPRLLYYTILVTHVPLAATVLPLAIVTVRRALRGRFDAHRRIARWTLPIWLYVAVTGVLVYLMLYRWFPSTEILTP